MNDIVNGRLWAPTPNGEQMLSTPAGPQGAVGVGASRLRVLARCTPFSAVSLSPLRFKISQHMLNDVAVALIADDRTLIYILAHVTELTAYIQPHFSSFNQTTDHHDYVSSSIYIES
jgi:hypothetical protein